MGTKTGNSLGNDDGDNDDVPDGCRVSESERYIDGTSDGDDVVGPFDGSSDG